MNRIAITVLTLLAVRAPAAVDALPRFAKDTPYAVVRKRLIALGYRPFKAGDADTCQQDARNCRLPEKETCSGVFPGYCAFTWQKQKLRIVVVTVGDPSIFDHVDTLRSLRR